MCVCLVAVPSTTNWRESTASQNLGQTATGASNNGNSAQQGATGITCPFVDNSEAATSAAATASDEGTFLSHVLRQIMPIISENAGSGSRNLSSDAHNVEDWRNRQGSTETQENADRASPSHRQDDDDPLLRPVPKRQRLRED